LDFHRKEEFRKEDDNLMVGYQWGKKLMLTFAIIDLLKVSAVKISRSAKINTKEGRDSRKFHLPVIKYNPAFLPDFVKV